MIRKVEGLTRHQIFTIATNYSRSPDEVSAEHYCSFYDISEAVFYRCLEKAVQESMVSEVVANMIASKAARNGERHGGEGARINSLRHYQVLIESRPTFCFNKRDQKKYAEMYAESELGFKEFCRRNYIPCKVLQVALVNAIQSCQIDDECVERIYQKSKASHGDETANRLFDGLREARRRTAEAKKAHERELRKARSKRKKAEKAKKEDDEKLAKQQTEFIQQTMAEFGIPDELREQRASLGIAEEFDESKTLGTTEDE